jgi:methylated-DNA-[protein]-cysteine S-methyltransferase
MAYTHTCDSPLGKILLASDGEALTGLWFEGQKLFAAGLNDAREERGLAVFEACDAWLALYFGGKIPDFTPALAPKGSAFQQRVWDALLRIPYGETVTYRILAERLGTSARAVGSAVGRNPVSLIIPCHRVIGADGSLTGYAGGVEKKRRLLEMERAGTPSVTS